MGFQGGGKKRKKLSRGKVIADVREKGEILCGKGRERVSWESIHAMQLEYKKRSSSVYSKFPLLVHDDDDDSSVLAHFFLLKNPSLF